MPPSFTLAERLSNRKLLTTISKFAGGNLVATVMNMLAGFLTARLVGPAVLGLFNSIGLVAGYAPWLMLGVGNGLGRELPYWMGKGDPDRARNLTAVAQAWAMAMATLSAAALAGIALWQAFRGRWDLAVGWAANAFGIWVLLFSTLYLRFTFRSSLDFPRLAKINMTQGVLSLFLVWLAALWGFYGLCVRAVVMTGAQLAQFWHWRPLKVRAVWSTPQFFHLLKVGTPIMLVGQLSAWWGTLNDTLILAYFDSVNLGLYALVSLGTKPLGIFGEAVSSVVYPHMTSEFGRTGNVRQSLRIATVPVLVLLPLNVVLIGLGWWLAPVLVPLLLPQYTAAIPALQWNLLIWLPLSFRSYNNVFMATGRMVPYFLCLVGGMLAYLAALHLILEARRDLVAYAQAMVVGRTVFMLLCFGYIAVMLGGERKSAAPASETPAP
jgi:O-antigen/teichoic acid export membrane protein